MKLMSLKNAARISMAALALLALPTLALADGYEGRPVRSHTDRHGKDLRSHVTFKGDVTTAIDRVDTRYEWVNEPTPVVHCTTEPGEGRGDWKGFYNAPKSEKPSRLAAAIQGVGIRTAERLVADGYFHRKPRSWSEFSSVIVAADRQYRTGFSREVLVTYGQQNARNLGYYAEESCQIVLENQLVLKAVEYRTFYKNVTKTFVIDVLNSALLKAESERFTIAFDGFNDRLDVSSSYNRYSVERYESGNTVTYRLSGQRLAVTPGNSLSVNAVNSGGQLKLQVTDNAFDAEMAGELGDAILVVEIYQHRALWADKKIASSEFRLNRDSATTEIQTGVRAEGRKQAYAKYSIKRVGSRYHGQGVSSSKESNRAQF
jgi:hypothetical protein